MNIILPGGARELEIDDLRGVRGGNPAITLGAAVAAAFGWGLKFGYTVVGPWLMGHDRC